MKNIQSVEVIQPNKVIEHMNNTQYKNNVLHLKTIQHMLKIPPQQFRFLHLSLLTMCFVPIFPWRYFTVSKPRTQASFIHSCMSVIVAALIMTSL